MRYMTDERGGHIRVDEYSDIPHFGFSRDQERQGLRQVVEDLFTWPIHSRRWRVIQSEVLTVLRGRAQARETTISVELLRAARATFSQVLPTLPPIILRGGNYEPLSFAQWKRELRRKVTRQITEDLLGPDWRKPTGSAKEALPQVTFGPEQDGVVEIRDLLMNEKLSVAERDVFRAFLNCDGDRAAAAQQLGLSTDAFDQRFSRACRKIREDQRAG
jgi:hypothetical protein